ncbi:hypothetical protein AVEN_107109-1 [Araneus ventricosus]|uniref:Uncharacterized protein n=1 Tax=Araneus ventricosus TaxID=182803 RepID=A0A4Y2G2V3_ARAVE|nr:hypothetical protein AVEN_107109-1 [Araneus ventricosus]
MDLIILNRCRMTKTTPELSAPFLISAPRQRKDVWLPTYNLKSNRPTYMADFQSNRVPNLELSGPFVVSLQSRDLPQRGRSLVLSFGNKSVNALTVCV